MSRARVLTDGQWARLLGLMPCSDGKWGWPFRDHRQVVEGIIYRYRTGVAWRDLPQEFGPWQTVWKRHRRLAGDGTWDRVLVVLLADADAAGELGRVAPQPSGFGGQALWSIPSGRVVERWPRRVLGCSVLEKTRRMNSEVRVTALQSDGRHHGDLRCRRPEELRRQVTGWVKQSHRLACGTLVRARVVVEHWAVVPRFSHELGIVEG